MKSGELSNEILGVCMEAQKRMLGVGHEQYASADQLTLTGEERQRFEDETPADQFRELEEELMDVINWAGMTVLKLRERREALAKRAEFRDLLEGR